MDITVYIAEHRGFCAGVERAVEMVERALLKYGQPVYVRHEIVHNKYVVNNLKEKGVIFVEELSEIPKNTKAPVIMSAHGVSKKVIEEAKLLNLFYFDATCPLVSKIHREAENLEKEGYKIFFIGHKGHPEVEGTIGQIKDVSNIVLIENFNDIEKLEKSDKKTAYITQTTLSTFDTNDLIRKLKEKFPNINEPKKTDICYATTNRQQSVQNIANKVEHFFILGAFNSSNSLRLVETAKMFGSNEATLIEDLENFDLEKIKQYKTIGLTASASAPESLVFSFLKKLRKISKINLIGNKIGENINFKVPNQLN